MKKTKNKKPISKPAPAFASAAQFIIKRRIIAWPIILLLLTAVVAYQVVRANDEDGLSLTAPVGTVARESQLDAAQQREEALNDSAAASQQSLVVQAEGGVPSMMTEEFDDAAR